MADPRMTAMGMNGQLPDVPSPVELWKNEKNKYRMWIILFAVGVVFIVALYLASVIWVKSQEEDVRDSVFNYYLPRISQSVTDPIIRAAEADRNVSSYFTTYILALPISVVTLLAIGLGMYGFGVFNSYKKKTFSELSNIPTMFVSIGAFIGFYELISMSFRGNVETTYAAGSFQIAARVLLIVVWIFISAPVARIRQLFIVSKQVTDFKNSPQFQEMQRQAQSGVAPAGVVNNFGIFGPAFGTQPAAAAPQTTPQQPLSAQNVSKEVQELNNMSVTDLRKIGKKLQISGHEAMEKSELIQNITRVTTPVAADKAAADSKLDEQIAKLQKMSAAELRKVAKTLMISGAEKMSKTELIDHITRIYKK